MIVILDSGPAGLVTNRKLSPESYACNTWLETLTIAMPSGVVASGIVKEDDR